MGTEKGKGVMAPIRARGGKLDAYEWGLSRKPFPSCAEALKWRKSLGPNATQADAYRVCPNGAWLLWQFGHLTDEEFVSIQPALERAMVRIVSRAIRRGLKALRGVKAPWATKWRRWARQWLDGSDRSVESARAMRAVAEEVEAAWAPPSAERAAVWAPEWAATAARAMAWGALGAAQVAGRKSAIAGVARAAERVVDGAVRAAMWMDVEGAAEGAAGDETAFESAECTAVLMATVAEESELQAQDIRREIPEWPGSC